MRRVALSVGLMAGPLALLAACSDVPSDSADLGVADPVDAFQWIETGDLACAPFYPANFCPMPPKEVMCYGDGEGCGPTVTDEEHAACPVLPPCTMPAPVPGMVWPGSVRDFECGRGFGVPWCFTACSQNAGVCPCHSGMDLAMRPGAPVYAVHDGTLAYIGPDSDLGHVAMLRMEIEGVGIVTAVYWHLATVMKKVGERVCAGERLGFVVQFGCADQAASMQRTHMHFSIWLGEPDFVWSAGPAVPETGDVCVPADAGVARFPSRFLDPMCLLRDAPMATDTCIY